MRSPLHSRKSPTLGQVEAEVNATRDAREEAPQSPQPEGAPQQAMSDADKFPTPFSYEAPPRDPQSTEQTAVPSGPLTLMGAVKAVPWWVWLGLVIGGAWAATKLLDDPDDEDEDESKDSDDSDESSDDFEDSEDDDGDEDDEQPAVVNRPRAKPRVTVKSRVRRSRRKTATPRFDLPTE